MRLRAELTPEVAKELGAFYTPPAMAEKLVEWAVKETADRVFDPSFGGLVFLEAAARRLSDIGVGRDQVKNQLFGAELDEGAYDAARRQRRVPLAVNHLHPGNFFDLDVRNNLPRCEAVVGNPPYIRYQGFNGLGRQAHHLARQSGVRLTRLASSWAPFLIHATSFVAPGGRLAQVLPAEFLHAQYAAAVKEFLKRNFSRVLIAVFDERVFPGALEEVVLLFAEGHGALEPAQEIELVSYANVADMQGLPLQSRPTRKYPTSIGGSDKLLFQLLSPKAKATYIETLEHERVMKLSSFGSVDIGAVTGDNSFFLLNRNETHGIAREVLRPTISKARHVLGARFTDADFRGLVENGEKMHLFVADAGTDPRLLRTTEAYLARGRQREVPTRYKCRVREPWWAVPLPGKGKPDLFLTYCSNRHPRLVVNQVGALNTNTVHGVKLKDARQARSLAARFVNSLTLLSAELVGRSYGGGVLKLEPTEAEELIVPRPTPRIGQRLKAVDQHLRESDLDGALDLVDPIVLGEGLGLTSHQIKALREGAAQLRQRRRKRNKRPA